MDRQAEIAPPDLTYTPIPLDGYGPRDGRFSQVYTVENIASNPVDSTMATDLFFLEACGKKGRYWREELSSRENLRLRSNLSEALRLFRSHSMNDGRKLLIQAEIDLQNRGSGSLSVLCFLWRYVFSIKAYLEFISNSLDAARANLDLAHEQIKKIIETDRFLLPLAVHCTDFITQKARIARCEQKWIEARYHIDKLEQIARGLTPFCVLCTGESIRLAELDTFFAALPLNEEQRRRAHLFLYGSLSPAEKTVRISERIFTIPDLVIPYP